MVISGIDGDRRAFLLGRIAKPLHIASGVDVKACAALDISAVCRGTANVAADKGSAARRIRCIRRQFDMTARQPHGIAQVNIAASAAVVKPGSPQPRSISAARKVVVHTREHFEPARVGCLHCGISNATCRKSERDIAVCIQSHILARDIYWLQSCHDTAGHLGAAVGLKDHIACRSDLRALKGQVAAQAQTIVAA